MIMSPEEMGPEETRDFEPNAGNVKMVLGIGNALYFLCKEQTGMIRLVKIVNKHDSILTKLKTTLPETAFRDLGFATDEPVEILTAGEGALEVHTRMSTETTTGFKVSVTLHSTHNGDEVPLSISNQEINDLLFHRKKQGPNADPHDSASFSILEPPDCDPVFLLCLKGCLVLLEPKVRETGGGTDLRTPTIGMNLIRELTQNILSAVNSSLMIEIHTALNWAIDAEDIYKVTYRGETLGPTEYLYKLAIVLHTARIAWRASQVRSSEDDDWLEKRCDFLIQRFEEEQKRAAGKALLWPKMRRLFRTQEEPINLDLLLREVVQPATAISPEELFADTTTAEKPTLIVSTPVAKIADRPTPVPIPDRPTPVVPTPAAERPDPPSQPRPNKYTIIGAEPALAPTSENQAAKTVKSIAEIQARIKASQENMRFYSDNKQRFQEIVTLCTKLLSEKPPVELMPSVQKIIDEATEHLFALATSIAKNNGYYRKPSDAEALILGQSYQRVPSETKFLGMTAAQAYKAFDLAELRDGFFHVNSDAEIPYRLIPFLKNLVNFMDKGPLGILLAAREFNSQTTKQALAAALNARWYMSPHADPVKDAISAFSETPFYRDARNTDPILSEAKLLASALLLKTFEIALDKSQRDGFKNAFYALIAKD